MKSLVYSMIAASVIVGVSTLTGCSSVPRTKWTDPTMRVMIDPDSIPANHYVRIQQALVESHKWVVVDRGAGFSAMKKEQELIHRNEIDRFEDREKWARWGHMYSVGGIVVAHVQCANKKSIFGGRYSHCQEYLAIMNANTGEVIATAEDDQNTSLQEYDIAPSWNDIVAKLNDAYPSHYEPNKDTKILDDYRDLSKEEAIRQKEEYGRQLASEKAEATKSVAVATEKPEKKEGK